MSENVPLKKLLISSSQYPKTQNLTHLKGKKSNFFPNNLASIFKLQFLVKTKQKFLAV